MIHLGKKYFSLNNSDNKALATQTEGIITTDSRYLTSLLQHVKKVEILISYKTNYENQVTKTILMT